jgi:MFS family permease
MNPQTWMHDSSRVRIPGLSGYHATPSDDSYFPNAKPVVDAVTPEKRNVLLLAAAQALFQSVMVLMITASGIVGMQLAPTAVLATLPAAIVVLAATATMIPASLWMQRVGRKPGFLFGAAMGCLGGAVAMLAIQTQDFWLFIAACALVGAYSGFAGYYRFAAADVASDAFRSRAISWVVAGGIVAAFAGTNIVRVTQHIGATPFLFTYLALTLLGIAALFVISRLSLPLPVNSQAGGTVRPLWTIIRQPVYITAVICSTVGFAMMSLVMTATPLAMLICGYSVGDSATVIQWHVLGMFVPSFFTGTLIQRFGVVKIVTAGIALLGGHVAVALTGIEFLRFLSGLTLLGVGWNFLFVGGTTLLTEAYRPAERAKVQAAHDFMMMTMVCVASFSAGGLLNAWGWNTLNITVLPFLLLAAAAIGGLAIIRR